MWDIDVNICFAIAFPSKIRLAGHGMCISSLSGQGGYVYVFHFFT